MNNIRIEGIMTCKTPLSHIGETYSTGGFFNTQEILTDDGWVRLPIYTGNALRGMLRRYAFTYFCNALQIQINNQDWFSKLTCGGGGNSTDVDLSYRKAERKLFPILSLFGYGLGTMEGKICSNDMLIISKENKRNIPSKFYTKNIELSSYEFLGNREFTRMDDLKSDLKSDNFNGDIETDSEGKKKVKQGESTTQMRYEVECIKPGCQWYFRFDLRYVNDLEIGCFISAIWEWSKLSRIGGMHNKGFGLVEADFNFINVDDNSEVELFLRTNIDRNESSQKATDYLMTYDTFLKKDFFMIMSQYQKSLGIEKQNILTQIEGK